MAGKGMLKNREMQDEPKMLLIIKGRFSGPTMCIQPVQATPHPPLYAKANRLFRMNRLKFCPILPKPLSISESYDCKFYTKPFQSQEVLYYR